MKYIEAPDEDKEIRIFLAGGITGCPNWQLALTVKLEKMDITLYNPRRANFPMGNKGEGLKQVKWEVEHLDKADAIVFWFPKETLCPITLFELGSWSMTSKPIFVGCHPDYQRRFDVETQLSIRRPEIEIVYSLDSLSKQIMLWVIGKRVDKKGLNRK